MSSPAKRSAPQQKPPRPADDQLKRHFRSLCAQIDGGHFKNAIKTCDKILRIAPRDADALQTKLFLLLQSDQYAAALSLLEQEPAIANGYLFEKAYVLYRMHKEDEAFEIIQGLGVNANDRGVSHLDAQLKYRQGDYESAQSIYNTLLDTSSPTSDEHTDIITNLTAAESHIDFLNKGYLTSLHSLSTPITTLESSAPPVIQPLSRSLPIPIPSTSQKPVAEEEKLKLKQPRKSRLPKHVVLGVTPLPDPERWLKKRERTKTQEGRGKKGKKAGMGLGATQGSTMGDKGVGVAQSAPTGGGGGKKSKKTK